MDYLARLYDDQEQLLSDHLKRTAELAGNFGASLDLRKTCYLAGLLHDLGKFGDGFQRYIRLPEDRQVRGSVDHATAGGRLLYHLVEDYTFNGDSKALSTAKSIFKSMVPNAIISHHNYYGLKNYLGVQVDDVYYKRVVAKELPDYEQACWRFYHNVMFKGELNDLVGEALIEFGNKLIELKRVDPQAFSSNLYFLGRYIFSCVLDADQANTIEVETGTEYQTKRFSFGGNLANLEGALSKVKPNSKVAKDYQVIFNYCKQRALKDHKVIKLSLPNGKGRVLTELRYAMTKAVREDAEHVVYVAPYTSILEQVATIYRGAVGEDQKTGALVNEYHSRVLEEHKLPNYDSRYLTLARDSWSAPYTVTTLVQFLNSFYGKGLTTAKRMHNLSKTIIILDEVQQVPLNCLTLFNKVLNYLVDVAKCEVVLSSSVLPNFNLLFEGLGVEYKFADQVDLASVGINERDFERVKFHDYVSDRTIYSHAKFKRFVQEKMKVNLSLAVVLNTRKAVKVLYADLADWCREQGIALYVLTSWKYRAHRMADFSNLQADLRAGKRVLCLSTSLIEFGVDLSFSGVIRAFCGIPSIMQTAGICNRYGEYGSGEVSVVALANDPDFDYLDSGSSLADQHDLTLDLMLADGVHKVALADLLNKDGLELYFNKYYQHNDAMRVTDYPYPWGYLSDLVSGHVALQRYYDLNGVTPKVALTSGAETLARNFKVIPDTGVNVVVACAESKELLDSLAGVLSYSERVDILNKLWDYMINLPNDQFTDLQEQGSLIELKLANLADSVYVLDAGCYDDYLGYTQSMMGIIDKIV